MKNMGYDAAIQKAWLELANLKPQKNLSVKFFADEYSVDVEAQKVLSLSCNVPAKDFVAILILHYLIEKLKGMPGLTGEWISFKELAGGESYYPAFRKRAIEPILRKYGHKPENIFSCLERLPAKKVKQADAAIAVDTFEGVPALVELWAGDDEFEPEANMLFDKNISKVLCTEDVAVLAGFVAKHI
jgi:hypothetical protein